MLSFEQIKELVALVADRRIESVELERAGIRLRIVGRTATVVAEPAPATGAPAASSAVARAAPPEPAPAVAERADPLADAHVLKSPIVGTFYAASSPDSPPFVKVGSDVGPDTTVCLIEAMKIFNEIKAECSGTIERVAVENGDAVDFGQTIFLVRPR